MKQVSIRQEDGHTYIFRWPAGMENKIVEAMAGMSALGYCSFDYFDTAYLSYQIGRTLAGEGFAGGFNEP